MLHTEFDQAVTVAYPRLLRHAEALLGRERQDAGDVLHSVLLEFSQRYLSGFNFVSQPEFERYITKAIEHHIFRLHKPTLPNFVSLDAGSPFGLAVSAPSVLDTLIERQERAEYEAVLEHLSTQLGRGLTELNREEFNCVMEVQSGCSFAELARRRGVKRQTVHQLYCRAMAKLRRALVVYGYTEHAASASST